jgi:hypothetical protein
VLLLLLRQSGVLCVEIHKKHSKGHVHTRVFIALEQEAQFGTNICVWMVTKPSGLSQPGVYVYRNTVSISTVRVPVWLLSPPRIWSGGKNVRGHAEARLCVLRVSRVNVNTTDAQSRGANVHEYLLDAR